ncbi:MAG TPA: filamentous hemagglutinin N-terminal domain-containing protein, partial [Planctomycetota bacterium]|nr:filamentous hemagglutinin N-terminal domain-containing protein [Planctomycetota bacterium]
MRFHGSCSAAPARWAFGVPLVLAAALAAVSAGPIGEQVIRGDVAFQRQGDLTTITASHNSIINYQGFNIAAPETVRFLQPSASARVLNRIISPAPTTIDGQLLANGHVYLVNPAGIIFGQNCFVNVGGIYAAAGNLSDSDFLAGIDRFTGAAGEVVNRGTIVGNSIALVGSRVANYGSILAERGTVVMAAGDDVLIGRRDGHLFVKIEGAAASGEAPAVENAGTVNAEGGTAVLGAGDAYSLAIRTTGVVKAADVTVEGQGTGAVEVGGTVDASSPTGQGGNVKLLGEQVGLVGATVDASGATGGGEILVGGNYQGSGPERNSLFTWVGPDSVLRADAGLSGNGGRVIVWSDGATGFYGSLSARGGALSGDGGFAEVSGKGYLDFAGSADLRAPAGNVGTILLDPTDINIGPPPDAPLLSIVPPLPLVPPSPPGYVVTDPGPAISNISTVTLAALLVGADVTIATSPGAGGLGNIAVVVPFDIPAGYLTPFRLILNADNMITVAAPLWNGGPGGITMNAPTVNIGVFVQLNGGDLAVTTDNFTVNPGGFVSAPGGISIAPLTAGLGFTLNGVGPPPPGDLSNFTLTNLWTNGATVTIGDATTGPIAVNAGSLAGQDWGGLTLQGAGVTFNGAFTLPTGTNLLVDAGPSLAVNGQISAPGGNVTFNAAAPATQTQPIVAAGLELLGTGPYTLTNASNDITTLAGSTGAVSFRDINGFGIGTVNTLGLTSSGNVTLQAGGAVTQTQLISATGLELLGAGPYTLTNGGNNITTLAGNTGAVSFTETDGFDIGTVNLTLGLTSSGNVTLQAGALVTQTQPIGATGLELLGAGPYTLTDGGNAVGTLAANTTGAITYTDSNALTVGTVNTVGVASGNNPIALTLAAGNTLTVSNALDAGSSTVQLSANDAAIGATVTGNSGITIYPTTTVTNIRLASSGPGLVLDDAELDLLSSTGTVTIGRTTNNGVVEIAEDAAVNVGYALHVIGGSYDQDHNTVDASAMTIQVDEITNLATTLTANGGLTIIPYTSGRPINIGDSSAANLDISEAELGNLVSSTGLTFGNATAGAVGVQDDDGTPRLSFAYPTTILSGGNIAISSTIGTGDLTLNTAGGTITVSQKITAATGSILSFTATGDININGAIDPPLQVLMDSDDDINVAAAIAADDLIQLRAGRDGTGSVILTGSGSLTTDNATDNSAICLEASVALPTGISGNVAFGGGNVTSDDLLTVVAHVGSISHTNGSLSAAQASLYGDTGVAHISINVATLAAGTGGAAGQDINLTDPSGGFSIGTVGTTVGVNAGLGNVTLQSGAAVTQSQALVATGLDLLGTGPYTLTNASNDIATLAGNTGAVSFRDLDGFDIGTVTTVGLTSSGDVTLQSGAAVTQSQALVASGLELLGSGPYTLTSASNDIATLAGNTGAVSFRDLDGFDIGTVTTVGLTSSGDVTLESGAAVTQSQALIATGLELLGTGPYTLTNASNDITTLAGNTGAVSFRDLDGFDIGTVTTVGLTSSGNVTLESGAAVTQSQALVASGLELLGSGPYTLSNSSNAITTLAANTTNAITYQDTDTVSLGTVGSTTGIAANGLVDITTAGVSGLTLNADIDAGAGGITLTGPVTVPNGSTTRTLTGSPVTFNTSLSLGSDTTVSGEQLIIAGNLAFGAGASVAAQIGTAAGEIDQLIVNGTVTLNNATFNGNLVDTSNPPPANSAFTFLSNDAADAITGTFAGGGSVTVDGHTFLVSYVAGDGNDIVLTKQQATRTWDGNSPNAGVGNGKWKNHLNWAGDTAPSEGDDLIFSGTTKPSPDNDFANGTTFNSITFDAACGDFTLVGNRVQLSSTGNAIDVQLGTATGTQTITMDIDAGATQTFNIVGGATLNFNSATLTLNNGVTLAGAGTFATNATGDIEGPGGLTIDMSGGTATFNGTVGASTALASVTVSNSSGVTFNDTFDAGTVALNNTTGTIAFNGTTTDITTALTVAAQGFNVAFNGTTNTIADNTNFQNTGTVTLGNGVGDTCNFTGGVATNNGPSGTNLAGNLNTTNAAINLGATTLTADATVTSGGGTINFIGPLSGPFNLAVNAGAGQTNFQSTITNLGTGTGAALTIQAGTLGDVRFYNTVNANSGIQGTSCNVRFDQDVTLGDGDTGTNLPDDVWLDGLTFSGYDDLTFLSLTTAGGSVTLNSNNSNI